MKKIIFWFFPLLFLSQTAKAFCPVCTVAVGAGVGLSRWLGIDDSLSGVWIGALIISLIGWTISWLNKKNFHFLFRNIVIAAGYYLLVLVPLYYGGMIGHPFNTLLGIDKILFGAFFGSIIFFLAFIFHLFLKKRNGGKVLFSYQKVVFTVSSLILLTLLLYFLTK